MCPITQDAILKELYTQLDEAQIKRIYCADYRPEMVEYWKERINNIENRIMEIEITLKSVFSNQ